MPGVSGVHIDRALSNLSLYYKNVGLVADVISPTVRVVHESDKYFVYGRENFRMPPSIRADRSETKEITYSLSTATYFCEEYGYHELISDRERANSDEALRPDIDTTEHLTDCLQLDKEYRIANNILNSSSGQWGDYSSTHFQSLAYAWDDKDQADPRSDIYHAKYMVFVDSRRQASDMMLPVQVSYMLAQMAQVDELRKYTDPGLVTNSGIPTVLWGLRIHECQSSYDSSLEGVNPSFSETWGNNVVIFYRNPAPISLKTLTFAVTLTSRPFEVRKWREEKKRCDCIETTHIWDARIIAPACGFVYTTTVSGVS